MIIQELDTAKTMSVTVTLSCDEVRDIANGLYERCKIADSKEYLLDSSKYTDVYKKAATLFELIKYGKITSHLLDILTDADSEESKDATAVPLSETHAKLIDGNALHDKLEEFYCGSCKNDHTESSVCWIHDILVAVESAPAIAEAER